MCEFISWIEYEKKNYFLTDKDLESKEGKSLIKFLGSSFRKDIKGHGAISIYWGIPYNTGKNLECENFSSPKYFPDEIAEAIKAGSFRGIGIALNLLNDKGKAEYKKIEQPALAEYKKIEQSAWAEYKKIEQDIFWDLFANPEMRNEAWK